MCYDSQLPKIELRRPPTLSDFAEITIKKFILENQLRPGQQISIDQLAEELGVSRTPIRDALMRLEGQDFVFSLANRSPRVTPITRELVHDLYVVREPLECLSVRLALPNITEDLIGHLTNVLAEISVNEELDPDKHFDSDTIFHGALLNAAGNEWLRRLLLPISDHVYRIRRFAKSMPGDHYWKAHQDHLELLEALRKRDSKAAERLMAAHIRNSRERIVALIS